MAVEFSAKDPCPERSTLALGLAKSIRNVYLAKKAYDDAKAKKEDTERLFATHAQPTGHHFPVPESAAVASPSELPPSIGSVAIAPASMAASLSSVFVATRQSTSSDAPSAGCTAHPLPSAARSPYSSFAPPVSPADCGSAAPAFGPESRASPCGIPESSRSAAGQRFSAHPPDRSSSSPQ